MNKEELNKMADKIIESDFFKKYATKIGTSIIIVYDCYNLECNCIQIQLDCWRTLQGIHKSFDKLVRELGEDLVSKHYVCKYDGSCANEAKIYFK